MKFKTQYNFEYNEKEHAEPLKSNIDRVDRAGYMSPEAILNSYDLAGIRLKLARDQLFTYNNESELENAKNSEKTKSFMDFDEAKARLDRAKKQIKTQSEYAKAIRDEFELYLAKAKEEGKIYQSPNNNTNTPSENNSPAN